MNRFVNSVIKLGSLHQKKLRKKYGKKSDRRFLDEVFLTIDGQPHYLWRAVDQDGEVIDILVQKRKDKKAMVQQKMKSCLLSTILVIDMLTTGQRIHIKEQGRKKDK